MSLRGWFPGVYIVRFQPNVLVHFIGVSFPLTSVFLLYVVIIVAGLVRLSSVYSCFGFSTASK
jgi:hypothetical protein